MKYPNITNKSVTFRKSKHLKKLCDEKKTQRGKQKTFSNNIYKGVTFLTSLQK